MKRLLSLLFISIFLYNSVGYFIVFSAQRAEIRKEKKMAILRLPTENATVIVLNKAELGKENFYDASDNELRYKDRMYDVIKQEQKGDLTYFYCISDEQEDALLADLNKHVNDHVAGQPASGKEKNTSLKNFTKDYFYETIALNQPHFIAVDDMFDRFDLERLSSRTLPVISPPPQVKLG